MPTSCISTTPARVYHLHQFAKSPTNKYIYFKLAVCTVERNDALNIPCWVNEYKCTTSTKALILLTVT